MAKAKEIKKEVKPIIKKVIMVRMYHQNNSVIDIKESEVKAHLAAGWRLNK